MKDQKLIYAMRDIDDDLICEAMKRRSIGVEQDGEEAETVYVSWGRTRRLWKYPVTAAAVLAVAGGALFVITYNGGISDNFGVAAGGETVGRAEETSGVGEITTESTDTAVSQIAPIKTIDIHDFDLATAKGDEKTSFQVLCVPSLPTIPNSTLGEECFNEMSTEELFEYYGLEFMLPKLISSYHFEVSDENIKHGIYISSDGTVDDINTFVFGSEEGMFTDVESEWDKLTVTIGKSSKFGQEYAYEHESFMFDKICYNQETDTFFVIYNVKGNCTVMLSGTTDELGTFSDLYDIYVKNFSELNEGVSPSVNSIYQYANSLFVSNIGFIENQKKCIEEGAELPWGKKTDEVTGDTMEY